MSPAVSVITPVYNRPQLVQRAAGSVLGQTFRDFELILVDDGSTDSTPAALEACKARAPDRVHVVTLPSNQGKSAALNEGLARAAGRWIAFLDSDDVWAAEKLRRQMVAVENSAGQCAACFTDAWYINGLDPNTTVFQRAGKNFTGEGGEISNPVEYLLAVPHGILIQTMLVSAELARAVGGFDTNLKAYEDYDFCFHLARQTRFAFVNVPLAQIDRAPGRGPCLMDLVEDRFTRIGLRQYMYEKWLAASDGLGPAAVGSIKAALAGVHSEWASWHLLHGRPADARDALAKADGYRRTFRGFAKKVLTFVSPGLTRRIITARTHG
jgi:glycosyltransferase involved in cell wall biosynthesis